LPGQETRILLAPHRLTDAVCYLSQGLHSPIPSRPKSLASKAYSYPKRPPIKEFESHGTEGTDRPFGWTETPLFRIPRRWSRRIRREQIDGVRIETAETFAIDWVKVKNDRLFDGDGKRIAQYYGFGEDVLAVADGTVVYVHDGMPDETPSTPAHPLRGSPVQSDSTTLRAECPVIRKSESRRAFSITRPSCGKRFA
jgi:hypothetical protein